MSDVKGVLLNSGKQLITSTLTGFSVIAPHSFAIGTTYGFEPDATDTAPRGTVVYTGGASLVQARALSDDTARYVLTVPESEGPFDIGNIVFYGTMWDNQPIPMFSVVLPFAYKKEISASSASAGLVYPTPGNRFIINITIKHSLDVTQVNVTVTTPTFSSLAFFKDNNTYPPPALNPWTSFVLHNDTRTGSPALVTTRSDGVQWGVPFWQSIRSPKFGILDAGVSGDKYKQEGSPTYIWGQSYTTPAAHFRGVIGGSSYTMGAANFLGNIGGATYV